MALNAPFLPCAKARLRKTLVIFPSEFPYPGYAFPHFRHNETLNLVLIDRIRQLEAHNGPTFGRVAHVVDLSCLPSYCLPLPLTNVEVNGSQSYKGTVNVAMPSDSPCENWATISGGAKP